MQQRRKKQIHKQTNRQTIAINEIYSQGTVRIVSSVQCANVKRSESDWQNESCLLLRVDDVHDDVNF